MTLYPPKLVRAENGKYIVMLNASAIKQSTCMRRLQYIMVEGLVPNKNGADGKDHKMEYGTAFHKAIAAHYKEIDNTTALIAGINHYKDIYVPENDFRTAGHLTGCISQYLNTYKSDNIKALTTLDKDGVKQYCVERDFCIPYWNNEEIEIILCGTIDMIGSIPSVGPIIVDHKTTSITSITSYLNSYELSPQLLTYKVACELMFGSGAVDWPCMINGIFLGRTGLVKFERRQYEYSTATFTEFKKQLNQLCADIGESFKRGYFYRNFAACEGNFGMCPFAPICSNIEMEGEIKENLYTTRVYDPREFQK